MAVALRQLGRRRLALQSIAARRSPYLAQFSTSDTSHESTADPVKPLSDLLQGLKASEHFDLIVIGSGPAGQKCAIDHVKDGKSVALIDKRDMIGGVCTHTGTIPSKTFREAVLHFTAHRHRSFYHGQSVPFKKFGVEDILERVKQVEDAEMDVTRNQLLRNGVELITGTARFLPTPDKKTVAVLSNDTKDAAATDATRHYNADVCKRVLTADNYLISVGTHPARRDDIPFDGETIFDSDQILWGGIKTVPKRLIVAGAGVIGMEYASMLAIVPGTEVTVIDPRREILDMADKEVTEALSYAMRHVGTRFYLEEVIKSVEKKDGEVHVELNSGKTVVGDALLYTLGRQGNTKGLNLEAVGIEADKRGLLKVDDNFQTTVPHIYAAGDCIGFPALASTSMEQGRLVSVHMRTSRPTNKQRSDDGTQRDPDFQHTRMRSGDLYPYGIYTIPAISMVGKNEQQLTSECIPYEVGIARYEELAKGQMLGGVAGFLKILFCPKTLKLLGVHAIGEGATEIIHIGQVVMSMGGTLDYFQTSVFNYPTLAEAYRVAALDGLSKVEGRVE